ncbi:MAG TPA: hypothetical protein VKX17_27120 [Planctomycetota bacterium]|nr:hypothetical protein [Planctomycetota bacterium]
MGGFNEAFLLPAWARDEICKGGPDAARVGYSPWHTNGLQADGGTAI